MSTPQALPPVPREPATPTAAGDLSSAYMAHTDAMGAAAAQARMEALAREPAAAATPAQSPAAAPAEETDTGQPLSGAITGEKQTPSIGDRLQGALDLYNKWNEAQLKFVGQGALELPSATFEGVRGAYQSVIDLAKDAGDFTNQYLPAIQFTDKDGKPVTPRFVSAEERRNNPDLPGSLADHISFPDLPEGMKPTTTAGKLEQNVIQFATGMMIAGKQLKAVGLPSKAEGWAGTGLTALKGIMSQFEAFNGAHENLSNLVQDNPKLANPVNEFLATKPDDADAVGRLKNAVEGTITGQALEGFVGALKLLRGAHGAAKAVSGAGEELSSDIEDIGPPKGAGMAALGNFEPGAPIVKVNMDESARRVAAGRTTTAGTTPQEVAAMAEEAAPKPMVDINFARVNTPEDVQRVMQRLADTFKGDIDTAKRGVQSFADTELGANSKNAWDILMSRRQGEPLNNEDLLAAKQLWVSASSKTIELARIASEQPTAENLFAFRKMLAVHSAVQAQFLGAQAEVGRALGALRIPVGTEEFRNAEIMRQLTENRPPDASILKGNLTAMSELATRVKAMADSGDIEHINTFAERGWYAKTRDAVLEAYTNALVTNPATHVKVNASNASVMALRIAERRIAEGYSSALQAPGEGVAPGEAASQFAGLVGGTRDAIRFATRGANAALQEPIPGGAGSVVSNAAESFKTGQYTLERDAAEAAGHAVGDRPGMLSSQALGINQSGWVGQGVDLLGQIVRTPGRALTAEHDVAQQFGYLMEKHALATRLATQEVLAGHIPEAELGNRVAQILENPPPSLKMGAIDAGKYQSWTDAPGALAELIGNAREKWPELKLLMPFYKIPSRIMSFTFERTPLAPLMDSYRNNIAAGGAREALARSQMGLGTMVLLAAADATMSGNVTGGGPAQKAQRESMQNQGWLPYSIKGGDGRYYQYNRLEPVGSAMAMAADVTETLQQFNQAVNGDDPHLDELAGAAALAIAQDVTSKTYFEGLANAFDLIANPKSEGAAKFRGLAGSFVPSIASGIDGVTDPYKRAVYSMSDAIRARIPGVSEGLPPLRNQWGEPIEHASGMGKAYDFLSPVRSAKPQDSPIDAELNRLQLNVGLPGANVSFGGGAKVNLQREDPKLYSRYVELQGNALKEPTPEGDLGLKDYLNSIVKGDGSMGAVYRQLPDGAPGDPQSPKAEMIRGIVERYRQAARETLLDENFGLRDKVEKQRESVQALRTPQ